MVVLVVTGSCTYPALSSGWQAQQANDTATPSPSGPQVPNYRVSEVSMLEVGILVLGGDLMYLGLDGQGLMMVGRVQFRSCELSPDGPKEENLLCLGLLYRDRSYGSG